MPDPRRQELKQLVMQKTCKWCGKSYDSNRAIQGGVINHLCYCSKKCEIAAKRQRDGEREERKKRIEEIKKRGGLGAKLLKIWNIIKITIIVVFVIFLIYIIVFDYFKP